MTTTIASTISKIPTASVSRYLSEITSLNSVYESATSVAATATKHVDLYSLSNLAAGASYSIEYLSNEVMAATATDQTVLASATQGVLSASQALASLYLEESFYSGMVPNYAFNLAMAIIFGILLLFNLITFAIYRQYWFGTAFVIATFLEMLGYIGRTLSHSATNNMNDFLIQFICLTIAPVFTMGGIYYQLAKLGAVYGEHFSRLKPIYYSYVFVSCDILSLVIQALGGGIAGTATANDESNTTGTHVFVGGLALQVFSMAIFLCFMFDFLHAVYIRAKKDLPSPDEPLESLYNPKYAYIRARPLFKYFNFAVTIATLFVFVRCIYRVVELAEGWSGFLMTHETYFIILDALMMSIATTIFVPFYPGFMFDGRHSTIPVSASLKKSKIDKSFVDEEKEANNDDDNDNDNDNEDKQVTETSSYQAGNENNQPPEKNTKNFFERLRFKR